MASNISSSGVQFMGAIKHDKELCAQLSACDNSHHPTCDCLTIQPYTGTLSAIISSKLMRDSEQVPRRRAAEAQLISEEQQHRLGHGSCDGGYPEEASG